MPQPPPQAAKSNIETLTPNGYFHAHNQEQSRIYQEAFSKDGFLVQGMSLTISQKPKQQKNERLTLNLALHGHLTQHLGGVKNRDLKIGGKSLERKCLSTLHLP